MTDIVQNRAILSETGRPIARERFSDGELGFLLEGFSKRFNDVFDNATQSEIGRQLGTTQATVREYMLGRRFPIAEILLTIVRRKGVNVHWLLTGEGEKWTMPAAEVFSEDEERAIRDLAEANGRTFQEQVKALASAAMEMVGKI